MTASRCFMFMYFLCPIGCPPRGGASRRPASGRSCRQGMFPPPASAGGSPGSAARLHCWYGCARPVLAGKIAVGQRFLNAILDLLGGLLHPHALVADDELYATAKPRTRSHWKKLTQLALSSFMPSVVPKTSRNPSSFTAIATRIATFPYSPPHSCGAGKYHLH